MITFLIGAVFGGDAINRESYLTSAIDNPIIPLTENERWNLYYESRTPFMMKRLSNRKSVIDSYLIGKKGKLFELGCGGSIVLSRCAMLGWQISGIDYNRHGMELLKNCLNALNISFDNLITGDVMEYDCNEFSCKYDMMVSFGFLEHFKNPSEIIKKWSSILKPGGLVVSAVPNLFSVNAWFLKKLNRQSYNEHIPMNPEQLDLIHKNAGLKIITGAYYKEKFDIDMLIPWDVIRTHITNKTAFRLIRYFSYYAIGKSLKLLPGKGLKWFNPIILGVYGVTGDEVSYRDFNKN